MTSTIKEFLNNHTCYDLLPITQKITILDLDLPLKKAHSIITQQGLKNVILYDAKTKQILTTDFINLLQKNNSKLRDVGTKTIVTLRPDDSVLVAFRCFVKEGVNCVLLVDECDEALALLDRYLLVKFVTVNCNDLKNRIFDQSIKSLGIGSFKNLTKITPETTVHTALQQFSQKNLTAIPVVDSNDCIIDVCEKQDIMDLLLLDDFLQKPISEFLPLRKGNVLLHLCFYDTPFSLILDAIRRSLDVIPRFFVVEKVNENFGEKGNEKRVSGEKGGEIKVEKEGSGNRLVGVVSTLDILKYIVSC